jgi:hypothetical protein
MVPVKIFNLPTQDSMKLINIFVDPQDVTFTQFNSIANCINNHLVELNTSVEKKVQNSQIGGVAYISMTDMSSAIASLNIENATFIYPGARETSPSLTIDSGGVINQNYSYAGDIFYGLLPQYSRDTYVDSNMTTLNDYLSTLKDRLKKFSGGPTVK